MPRFGLGTTFPIRRIVGTIVNAPSAPTGVAVGAVGADGFTVSWTASATDGTHDAPTSYRIDVATDSAFSGLVVGYQGLNVGTAVMWPISGLAHGTQYWARVRAVNAAGSAQSASTTTTTTISIPTAPILHTISTITTTTFIISWPDSDVDPAHDAATSYVLDVATAADFSALLAGYTDLNVGDVNTKVVTGLSADTTYYARLRASNSGGTSSNSATEIATTIAGAPNAPAAPNGTVSSDTAITWSWNAPAADASHGAAASYGVDVAPIADFSGFVAGYQNRIVSGTTLATTELQPGTQYWARVRAVNTGGVSANSPSGTQTTSGTSGGVGTVFSDTFVAAHGGLNQDYLALHAPDEGMSWTVISSAQFDFADNRLMANANIANYATTLPLPGSADYTVAADVIAVSMKGDVGLVVRLSDSSNLYRARYSVLSSRWELHKMVAGVVTNLGAFAQALTLGQVYRLSLDVNGSTLTVAVDGVTRISATDTTFSAAGQAGALLNAGGAVDVATGFRLDNFVQTGVRVVDTTVPAAPSGLIASAPTGTEVDLSWNANSESDVQHYRVARDGVLLGTVTVPTHGYRDNTAEPSTTYAYAVSAVDRSANESERATTSATTPPEGTAAPATPQGLQGSVVDATHADVRWTANTEADLDHYIVYLRVSGPASAIATVTPSGNQNEVFHDSDLTPGSTVYYAVSAVNQTGSESARTAEVGVVLPTPPTTVMSTGSPVAHATFAKLSVYIPFTGGDNQDVSASMRFKQTSEPDAAWTQASGGWRAGLPPQVTFGADTYKDSGGLVQSVNARFVACSVLLAEQNTSYDVDITLTCPSGIGAVGTTTQRISISAATRAETEIPNFAALTPTRYIRADGSDANDGTTPATAWRTLSPFCTTNTSAPVDGARMVCQIGPGVWYGGLRITGSGPRTLLAQYPAVAFNGPTDDPTSWHVINQGNHSRLLPRQSGVIPAGTAWTLENLSGPGNRGAPAGTVYQCYSTPLAVRPARIAVEDPASPEGDLVELPVFKRTAVVMSTAAGWLEWLHTNRSWSIPTSDAFGAYYDTTGKRLYVRLQDDANPAVKTFIGVTGEDIGIEIADQTHLSGLHFRGNFRAIVANQAHGALGKPIVDHCLSWADKSLFYPVSHNMTASGGVSLANHISDPVVQYCIGRGSTTTRTGLDDLRTIPWLLIKQTPRCADDSNMDSNRLTADMESSFLAANGGAVRQVVRRCLMDGPFNGAGKGYVNNTDHFGGSFHDVYENYFTHIGDDSVEYDSGSIEDAIWANSYRDTDVVLSTAPHCWGTVYFFRNSIWRAGDHLSRPPDPTDTHNLQNPGVIVHKYGNSAPNCRLWWLHNTVWVDNGIAMGDRAGERWAGKADATQNSVQFERIALNNVVRVTFNRVFDIIYERTMTTAQSWLEDYNLFTTNRAQGDPNDTTAVHVDLNNVAYTTLAAYRAELAGNVAGYQALHTNRWGGADHEFDAYADIDAALANTATGDLRPKAGSFLIAAGVPVPNISDRAGVDYAGSAPTLGYTETTG